MSVYLTVGLLGVSWSRLGSTGHLSSAPWPPLGIRWLGKQVEMHKVS